MEGFLERRNETDETDDFRPNELSDGASTGVGIEGECPGFGSSSGKVMHDFLKSSIGKISTLASELWLDPSANVDVEVAAEEDADIATAVAS